MIEMNWTEKQLMEENTLDVVEELGREFKRMEREANRKR